MRKVSTKKLIIPILAAVLLLFSLPVNAAELSQTEQAVSASVTAGASGYVNGDGVNLRSGAGTSYSVVTVMEYKTEFTFDDGTLYNGEWYKITLSDGTKGYIYYEYAAAKEVTDITVQKLPLFQKAVIGITLNLAAVQGDMFMRIM